MVLLNPCKPAVHKPPDKYIRSQIDYTAAPLGAANPNKKTEIHK
jgi:hypothetical protein